ncbi:lambda exonuclease family protein [Microbulbifer sp. VVAC002]|uniref:lambda exonuclease family protein n=1 Tax=Microbulbifer sp. VVAC002 TaxID=3243387 RepID=UPI004039701C
MITCKVEQGSEEWHRERAGAITASNFSEVRKRLKSGKNKGDFTAAAHDYAFRLAVERISGEPLDGGFQTWAMKRGNELEPEARAAHEDKIDMFIEQTGLVLTDDRKFGASADGLIGEDGGSEYKCLVSPERLRTILLDENLDEFKDQIQGCMWLTGRKWWHFVLYCPALDKIGKALTVRKMERDDNYINELEMDLLKFDKLVEEYRSNLTQKAA